MKNVIVKIENVNKSFGEAHIVKNLSMDIYEGEFLTLLGPSGCGKTTTLRMLAGFEEPTSGLIELQGEKVQGKEPYDRDVNTVFQSYALFPHMNIYDNIAFGLTMKKVSKSEIKHRVTEMLELVQLSGYEKRKPSELSGGQKQRVAIARALINNPKVLLLDEPLGALDLKLRKKMQVELKRLQKRLGITFIYVTHDQEEALTMSDRIAIMNGGILEQVGTPDEIYERPLCKFVADFIGESNIFYGTIKSNIGEKLTVSIEAGEIPSKGKGFVNDEIVYVSVRPENMKLSQKEVKDFSLIGVIKEHIYVGSIIKTMVVMQTGEELKINQIAGTSLMPVGTTVYPYWEISNSVTMHSKDNKVHTVLNSSDEKKLYMEEGVVNG